MEFSSKLLENAVNEIAQLPGIGKRTALRLVLHLLKQPKENTSHLTQALNDLRDHINFVPPVTICLTCLFVRYVQILREMILCCVWWRTSGM